jgi:hypothetical protein
MLKAVAAFSVNLSICVIHLYFLNFQTAVTCSAYLTDCVEFVLFYFYLFLFSLMIAKIFETAFYIGIGVVQSM